MIFSTLDLFPKPVSYTRRAGSRYDPFYTTNGGIFCFEKKKPIKLRYILSCTIGKNIVDHTLTIEYSNSIQSTEHA